jgi:hypothetical protein
MNGRRVASLLFCVLLAASGGVPDEVASQARVSAQHFRIMGVVVNARDDAPIPRCHMTAELAGGGGRRGRRENTVETDSDASGHFVLEVPADGDWQVVASAYGFRSQSFQEHEGFFTGVVLTAKEPVYTMTFRAVPDAVLSGTVTDEAGEPVRDAQVSLFVVHPEAAQTLSAALTQREMRTTDDRGHYEFARLDAEVRYKVRVMAHPWYASPPTVGAPGTVEAAALDPSLDVVYPVTWYPGVGDDAAAEAITAHPGERLQADFRLFPVASAHLVIPASALPALALQTVGQAGGGDAGQRMGGVPRPMANVQLMQPGGSTQPVSTRFTVDAAGNMEVSGLVPGTYRVSEGRPGDTNRVSTVVVRGGGSVTEVASPNAGTEVSIAVDGGTSVRASQILLVDTVSGTVLERGGGGPNGFGPPGDGVGRFGGGAARQAGGSQRPGQNGPGRSFGQSGSGPHGRDRGGETITLAVPPGRYEVKLAGGNNSAYMTGMTAVGAEARGRFVTVGEQPARLTVHLAAGLANVEGTAMFAGKLSVGAMLLLVPATLGDPSSLTIVRRDQTNTDGGFSLDEVIPGPYILLAIDHGWGVRWEDPATLAPYLMHGVPLDLRPQANVRQTVQAVSP